MAIDNRINRQRRTSHTASHSHGRKQQLLAGGVLLTIIITHLLPDLLQLVSFLQALTDRTVHCACLRAFDLLDTNDGGRGGLDATWIRRSLLVEGEVRADYLFLLLDGSNCIVVV